MTDTVITLIGQTYTVNENGEEVVATETPREIWAAQKPVKWFDWKAAGTNIDEFHSGGTIEGMRDYLMFSTPEINYMGERVAEVNGKRYDIFRTYPIQGTGMIELHLLPKVGVTYGG